MKYEYKAVLIVKYGDKIDDNTVNLLNEYFSRGWEYVDSIVQHKDYSGIGVILRKPLENENLLP